MNCRSMLIRACAESAICSKHIEDICALLATLRQPSARNAVCVVMLPNGVAKSSSNACPLVILLPNLMSTLPGGPYPTHYSFKLSMPLRRMPANGSYRKTLLVLFARPRRMATVWFAESATKPTTNALCAKRPGICTRNVRSESRHKITGGRRPVGAACRVSGERAPGGAQHHAHTAGTV